MIPLRGNIVTPEHMNQFQEMLKKNQLKYHQFYNTEIETDEFSFIKFMRTFKDNRSSKLLNKSYYDIEIYTIDEKFPDPLDVDYEVNAVTIYNNIKNESKIFYFYNLKPIDAEEIKQAVIKKYRDLCIENNIYEVPDMNIEVLKCDNEKEIFIEVHKYLRSLDTLMLIGFNSMIFDDPYMMNRGIRLFGEERYYEMVSDFQVTKYSARLYEWPDYLNVDLLKVYQPVDSGGMGFGKSLPDYKMNTVAKKELGISKLELEGNFLYEYTHNLVNYLTYNMLDTLLVYKLDDKLKFIEQIFSLAKHNKATMGASINGRSIMYLYRNDLIYTEQDTLIRNKKYSKEIFYEIEKEPKKK